MKRRFHAILAPCCLGGCLLMICMAVTLQAAEFRLQADGGIRVNGLQFASMKEYVKSDYFRQNGMRCGVRIREASADEQLARSTSHCTNYLTSIQDEYWSTPVFIVPVWWHVIYRSDGLGYIDDAGIEAQMEALNEDYRAMAGTAGANGYDVRIQFELAGIDRTKSDAWFSDISAAEAYKKSLAKNTRKYINIYTNDAGGVLGYAYLPQGSAGTWWDGIVLYFEAVGGRDNGFAGYDQGRTLVHEMGHYLGLFHTFEGGCTNSYSTGDLIKDTNAEAGPNFDVCSSVSTCGSVDPIHNYMDYSYDVCMYKFTREQANRAICSLVNYRRNLFSSVPAVAPLLRPLILKN